MTGFKAINTQNMSSNEIEQFIIHMREVIGTRNGGPTSFIKDLKLDRLHPLRFLLGRDDFTDEQLRFAEGVYCLVKELPVRHTPSIWVDSTIWHPCNPNVSDNELDDLVWDQEFCTTIVKGKKDLEMLLNASASTLEKLDKGVPSKVDIVRAQIALMCFGFPEPEQFFKSN